MVGFSLKTKSAPSRAPAASITADEHAARSVGEVALGRQLRPEFGESFHGAQQPAEIVGLHGHDEVVRER